MGIQGKTVLIVDDDQDIVTAIRAALEETGLTIRSTGNGNTAVKMLEENPPDLLILDQMLPGRSGFLIMERIRPMRKEGLNLPVIMITANPGARHKTYAESLGVNEYINKPFRMEKLVKAAERLLGGGEAEADKA